MKSPSPISQARLERLLRDDQTDELMENVIELYEQVVQQAYRDGSALDLIVVEGVVPTQHTTYATQTNAQLAHALNARIILVGTGDLNEPQALAEELVGDALPGRVHWGSWGSTKVPQDLRKSVLFLLLF